MCTCKAKLSADKKNKIISVSFHFKNEHALFLFKAPRQSMSVLIYGEEILAFSLRVGL